MWNVTIPGSNSRDTYFSIHNISDAHRTSKGKGVKIGILDWGFGFNNHSGLYAGGRCFSDEVDNFYQADEHGYWMALVLKEIAPECEIYALGTFTGDENKWVDALIEAIGWSVKNGIEVLALSHQKISDKNRARFDEAVNKAVGKNIVTTFIHYDSPNNLFPWGLFEGFERYYKREPDVNIFHYDYNTVFLERYSEYLKKGDTADTSEMFLSVSATSPVTAGFVAILKGIKKELKPSEYKEILIRTSYQMNYRGANVNHVADIGKAVDYMMKEYAT